MDWISITVDYGIISLLILLSIASVAVALERVVFFAHINLAHYNNPKALELALTSRLGLIGTVGSNAPYIGLLGTVLGIMLTFYNMGQGGAAIDAGKIMVGLALALKATAVGLIVALIAVVLYNMLLRKVKVLLMQWEILQDKSQVNR